MLVHHIPCSGLFSNQTVVRHIFKLLVYSLVLQTVQKSFTWFLLVQLRLHFLYIFYIGESTFLMLFDWFHLRESSSLLKAIWPHLDVECYTNYAGLIIHKTFLWLKRISSENKNSFSSVLFILENSGIGSSLIRKMLKYKLLGRIDHEHHTYTITVTDFHPQKFRITIELPGSKKRWCYHYNSLWCDL